MQRYKRLMFILLHHRVTQQCMAGICGWKQFSKSTLQTLQLSGGCQHMHHVLSTENLCGTPSLHRNMLVPIGQHAGLAEVSTPGLLLLQKRYIKFTYQTSATQARVILTHINFGSSVCGFTGMVEQYGTYSNPL